MITDLSIWFMFSLFIVLLVGMLLGRSRYQRELEAAGTINGD